MESGQKDLADDVPWTKDPTGDEIYISVELGPADKSDRKCLKSHLPAPPFR